MAEYVHHHVDSSANKTKGVDDILALLLAFSAKPEELEVVLVSITFGNIDVQKYAHSPQKNRDNKCCTLVIMGDVNQYTLRLVVSGM